MTGALAVTVLCSLLPCVLLQLWGPHFCQGVSHTGPLHLEWAGLLQPHQQCPLSQHGDGHVTILWELGHSLVVNGDAVVVLVVGLEPLQCSEHHRTPDTEVTMRLSGSFFPYDDVSW